MPAGFARLLGFGPRGGHLRAGRSKYHLLPLSLLLLLPDPELEDVPLLLLLSLPLPLLELLGGAALRRGGEGLS